MSTFWIVLSSVVGYVVVACVVHGYLVVANPNPMGRRNDHPGTFSEGCYSDRGVISTFWPITLLYLLAKLICKIIYYVIMWPSMAFGKLVGKRAIKGHQDGNAKILMFEDIREDDGNETSTARTKIEMWK